MKIRKIIITTIMLSLLIIPLASQADLLTPEDLGLGNGTGDTEGAAAIGLGQNDLMTTINSIIRVLLGFLGILAVIIILWGGFIWMTAMGDEGKVDKAKKLIIAGIVGVVIILAAYAIAEFVIKNALTATGADGTL